MKTLNYDQFLHASHDTNLGQWLQSLSATIEAQSNPKRHGHFTGWLDALHSLPDYQASAIDLNSERVSVKTNQQYNVQQIESALKRLRPWRKGPFQIDDLFIDSEWRSNLKWDRIKNKIAPLAGRNVLDVGCGNGYYGYRMLGAGAKTVVGVDPGELFCTQFAAVNHFIKSAQLSVLPLTGEMIFANPYQFDTVFSMGVVSHRRDPQEHLKGLLECLRDGGELVLETLIIDHTDALSLVPQDRYANMRNVWILPSLPLLTNMLSDAGFSEIKCIDSCKTTTNEQRSTDWMPTHSLINGLNPDDPNQTIEGHPAPTRCVVIAQKPGKV